MVQRQATGSGSLYIVATPLGNLEDITHRAIRVLQSVDSIFAEDTRHSLPLLTALGIKKPLSSLHAHNEESKSQFVLNQLLEGKSIAYISDAGTPLISDPGYILVHQAQQLGIQVIPIPGPCALITALSAAGVPCDSFLFLGFLPAKTTARKQKLLELKDKPHTLVFYESTHRILACLDDMQSTYGETCQIVLAKELTKTYERFVSGTAEEIIQWLLEDPGHIKGEFVLIIPPRPIERQVSSENQLLRILLEELPLKQAVSLASKLTGINKNSLYDSALQLKNQKE